MSKLLKDMVKVAELGGPIPIQPDPLHFLYIYTNDLRLKNSGIMNLEPPFRVERNRGIATAPGIIIQATTLGMISEPARFAGLKFNIIFDMVNEGGYPRMTDREFEVLREFQHYILRGPVRPAWVRS